MTSNFDRAAAEQDIKHVAAEASYHSSGTILNAPDPSSSYQHGKLDRTGSVDGSTSLPTTSTTVDGAYSIGSTDASGVADRYENKFTSPATEVASGTGSRTVQAMPELVQDLGTTVQTQRTTRAVVTETTDAAYIPPATTTPQVVASTYTAVDAVPQHNSTSTVQHHGIIGHNQTLDASNVKQDLNAASGATVGAAQLGIPHSTGSHSLAQDSSATGNHHTQHTATGGSDAHKESMMSKIKHVFKK